jgi:hypothetical protein
MLARRLAVHPADAQLLTHHANFLQAAEDVPGHALGEVDEGVIVTDVHVADVFAFQTGLVGDRADDVARLHAVGVAHFEAEGFKRNVAVFATSPPVARTALASRAFTVFAGIAAIGVCMWHLLSLASRARAEIALSLLVGNAAIGTRMLLSLASRMLAKALVCMLARIAPNSTSTIVVSGSPIRAAAVVTIAALAPAKAFVGVLTGLEGLDVASLTRWMRSPTVVAPAAARPIVDPIAGLLLRLLRQQQGR